MSQNPTNSMNQRKTTGKSRDQLKASFQVTIEGRTKTYLVHKSRVVIGSVESADLKLNSNGVAPIHAVVEINWHDDPSRCEAKILDLASPTGVLVNDVKVIHETLRPGDRVRMGEASFVFGYQLPTADSMLPDQALLLIDAQTVEPIFDYRPEVKDTLEVVYSWNESILDVQHHLGEGDSATIVIPPIYHNGLSKTLAQKVGNRWNVMLDSQMKGVIYQNGSLKSISEAQKASSTVSMGENDFAKIEIGSISIYLSQTVAPPVLVKRFSLVGDPFLAKSLIASLALSILMIVGVSKIELQPEPVSVSEPIATIIYHPEKYSIKKPLNVEKPKSVQEAKQPEPEPEKPKKAEIDFSKPKDQQGKTAQTKSPQPGKKQVAQGQSKEGEGARAKGAEGARGSKNAKASNSKQNAANRPSPTAGNDRGGTQSQTQDNGNLQMVKGTTSKILDLLGGSGQKLGKSGSKLSGFGGFSTQGNGGLALSGSGKGGGGNADTLLGGLGEKGRGGGKVGTGLGAEGTGSGIVGGKTRVELNVGGGEETVVVGAIDRDAIEAAIRAHRNEFLYCYEREVNAGSPNLSGKVFTAFVIGGSGKASQLSIASSSINSANVDRCVLGVLSRIQFPLPAGGVPVTIKYPFNFANKSK